MQTHQRLSKENKDDMNYDEVKFELACWVANLPENSPEYSTGLGWKIAKGKMTPKAASCSTPQHIIYPDTVPIQVGKSCPLFYFSAAVYPTFWTF